MRTSLGALAVLLAPAMAATAGTLEVQVNVGGKPAAAASVTAWPLRPSGGLLVGGTCAEGIVRPDGRCRLEPLDPGPYRLEAALPNGSRTQVEVVVPAVGSCLGILRLPPAPRPDRLEITGPAPAPAGAELPLTAVVSDSGGRPIPAGMAVRWSTSLGTLRAGRTLGSAITVPVRDGRSNVALRSARPGEAEVTARLGSLEAVHAVRFHGPLAYLILEAAGDPPGYPHVHPPPGEAIPIVVRPCDAGGRPIPDLPIALTCQRLPAGPRREYRGRTGADGLAVALGVTSEEPGEYRVIARHGRVQASRDFLTLPPPGDWLGAVVEWSGAAGRLRLAYHGPRPAGREVRLSIDPPSAVATFDDAWSWTDTFTTDDTGAAEVRLLRLRPGRAVLRATARGVREAVCWLGAELHAPDTAERGGVPLPEPAYERVDAAAGEATAPAAEIAVALREGAVVRYRVGTLPGERLLVAGEPRLGPPRPLRWPDGVAVPLRPNDDRPEEILLRLHRYALGQTEDVRIVPDAPALRFGVDAVWDVSPDGRRVLLSSVPLSTDPPGATLWVCDTHGRAELVAIGWRRLDAAEWRRDTVRVVGVGPPGTTSPAYYRPISEAAGP